MEQSGEGNPLAQLKLAAQQRQRQSDWYQAEAERIVTEFRSELIAGNLPRGRQIEFDRQSHSEPPTLVIIQRAFAVGQRTDGARASDWWNLIIGRDIPATIQRWTFDQPIPLDEYEVLRESEVAVDGLAKLMRVQGKQGLSGDAMLETLKRAIGLWRYGR